MMGVLAKSQKEYENNQKDFKMRRRDQEIEESDSSQREQRPAGGMRKQKTQLDGKNKNVWCVG